MNEKVRKYLEETKDDPNTEKNKTLIKLGLYERVYYEGDSENPINEGYPFYDTDEKEFYKKVACEVNEEEYQEILRSKIKKENNIYLLFFALAIVMFTVAIGYLIFCISQQQILPFFIYGSIMIGIGVIILGNAFIIKYLTEYKN